MSSDNDLFLDLASDFKLGGGELALKLDLEALAMPSHGYSESELFERWRTRAVTIIFNVSANDIFEPYTPYLAMNYYDRFVSGDKGPLPGVLKYKQHDLELLCFGCLTLACKAKNKQFSIPQFLGRHYHPLYITPGLVKTMELRILKGINSHVNPVTAWSFVPFFAPELDTTYGYRPKTITEIIIQSQNDFVNTQFRPSVIAASALLAASVFLYPEKYESFIDIMSSKKIFANDTLMKCTEGLIEMCMRMKTPIESTLLKKTGRPGKRVRAQYSQTREDRARDAASTLHDAASTSANVASTSAGGAAARLRGVKVEEEPPRPKGPEYEIVTEEEERERIRDEMARYEGVRYDDWVRKGKWNARMVEAAVKVVQKAGEEVREEFEEPPPELMGEESEEAQFWFLLRWKIGRENSAGFRIFSDFYVWPWAGHCHTFCNYCCCCYCCPPGCNPC